MTDAETGLPHFTHAMQVAWIAEHAALPPALVDRVLTIEWEYMVATGIAEKRPGTLDWDFRYYEPGEISGCEPIVDTDRIARDSERLAGVPYDVAMTVLDNEFEFLKLYGLA